MSHYKLKLFQLWNKFITVKANQFNNNSYQLLAYLQVLKTPFEVRSSCPGSSKLMSLKNSLSLLKPQCLPFSTFEYSLDLFPSILNSMKVSFDRKMRNTLSWVFSAAKDSGIIIGYIIITIYEVVYKPSSERASAFWPLVYWFHWHHE